MASVSQVKEDVEQCRRLIEENLRWVESSKWTRRDYELLVELIFEKTGILLSLSTIRRIWNDDFKNIPHKSTLDALAMFAGFSNWQNFYESRTELPENREPRKKRYKMYAYIGGIGILAILSFLIIVVINNRPDRDVEIVGSLNFEYTQRGDTSVPSIVVFDYNVEYVVADSFFIVESTHNYKKKRLTQRKGQLTSAYYHPGNYEAFLVANDSVIKKLSIEIRSNEWVGMVNYHKLVDHVPFYFYTPDIIDNGSLTVSRSLLIKNNIRIEDDLFVTFSSTFKTEIPLFNNFIYSTSVKSDSVEINSSSPTIFIGLIFEHDLCYVPIVQNGGQDKLQIKYGKTILSSNDSDLSGLGCDIYNWQELEIVSQADILIINLNGHQILALKSSSEMGFLKGFLFNFEGIGSVDFVSLRTLSGDTVYFDSF